MDEIKLVVDQLDLTEVSMGLAWQRSRDQVNNAMTYTPQHFKVPFFPAQRELNSGGNWAKMTLHL
jgi:hypothetical protein